MDCIFHLKAVRRGFAIVELAKEKIEQTRAIFDKIRKIVNIPETLEQFKAKLSEPVTPQTEDPSDYKNQNQFSLFGYIESKLKGSELVFQILRS